MLNKERNKKSVFEDRFKYILPSQNEMKIVAKANNECFYYLAGVGECRDKVLLKAMKKNSEPEIDFFDCKPVTEAYYRCVTKDQHGESLEDMEQAVRPYFKNFSKCIFEDFKEIGECRKYHDDILRHYVRQGDAKLDEAYS